MDRVFLDYYEEELAHIRSLATEFAAIHPAVARNLSLDSVPCPDPYVERLLEGVAFLSARTRLKVDAEGTRYVRSVLDALYPDLVGPMPAVGMAILHPGPQVQSMPAGHTVRRGARLVSGLREGLATRATYSTAQDVTLWPVRLGPSEYLQNRGALLAAGLSSEDIGGADSALRLTVARSGAGQMAELALDRLDIHFAGRTLAPALFDTVFGAGTRVLARPADRKARFLAVGAPEMIGVCDGDAMLPRLRPAFEGYRLLREYFAMPDRFHFMRLPGLGPAVAACMAHPLEIVLLFNREAPALAGLKPGDLALFATPVINLFERECNAVDLDPRRTQVVVHADRTRPRDFEIYRLIRVEDADTDGTDAVIPPLHDLSQNRGSGWVHSVERRPRRPGEDEVRRGQLRTSYAGDDLFISVSRSGPAPGGRRISRLDIRALCTNRDIAILDDTPVLGMESGDPVARVELLGSLRPPRPSLAAALPQQAGGETRADDLAWRLVSQLSLNFLSLAEESRDAEPLRALLDLYAGRGDPAIARHARAVTRVTSRGVVDRLAIPGPLCFGHGVEITLHVDEGVLTGHSLLLPGAILARILARHVAINSFVRTRIRFNQRQEEVAWPMTPGIRPLI
jgi:type VI secretion system protein ImpG